MGGVNKHMSHLTMTILNVRRIEIISHTNVFLRMKILKREPIHLEAKIILHKIMY